MQYYSAWEDILLERTEQIFNYKVYNGETLLFQGRSYKRPNADYNVIKVNKIFENYLSNSLLSLLNDRENTTEAINTEACKVFQVYKIEDDDTETLVEEYNVLYDWSYSFEYANDRARYVLSQPINGKYVAGMLKLNTIATHKNVTNSLTDGDYNLLACGDYALYYLNAMGGFDALLIEGAVVKKSTITQYTTDKNVNNKIIDFEQQKYINEIQDSYELNTGFFTDNQAEILSKNLIPSKEVYLHNLKTDKIIPVLITDTNVTFQTYATNGLQMPQYKINVKESMIKLRK